MILKLNASHTIQCTICNLICGSQHLRTYILLLGIAGKGEWHILCEGVIAIDAPPPSLPHLLSVCYDHHFKDDYLFYRFKCDEKEKPNSFLYRLSLKSSSSKRKGSSSGSSPEELRKGSSSSESSPEERNSYSTGETSATTERPIQSKSISITTNQNG